MEEFIKQLLPYIILAVAALVWIFQKSKPHIVRMIKSKADRSEADLKAFEEKLAQDRKKDEIKSDAQNFLSDVGRNYFKVLAEEAEGLRTQLTDSEETIANLEEKLQQTILEREEFKIKYNTINEAYQDYKERLVFAESNNIKKDLLLQELESTVNNQKNVMKQMETDLATKNQTISDLKNQLEVTSKEKEAANKRFDEERKQNDMLMDEIRKLREDK